MNRENSLNIPHLFHIGTQRAGSTFLYNLLLSHGDISLHKATEIQFYSGNFEKGLDWYLEGFCEGKYRIDTSPKYFMQGEVVAPRIKEHINKYAKGQKPLFLLILRNPIDYLSSHYQTQVGLGYFTKHTDMTPTKSVVDFVKKYPQYLERAYYYQTLTKYWLPCFSPDQFMIISFEEFVSGRPEIMKSILSFWKLPIADLTASKVSTNRMLRFKPLYFFRHQIGKRARIKDYLKESRCFNFVFQKFLTKKSTQALKPEEREYLKNIFQDDVGKLRKLLKKDFALWGDFENL